MSHLSASGSAAISDGGEYVNDGAEESNELGGIEEEAADGEDEEDPGHADAGEPITDEDLGDEELTCPARTHTQHICREMGGYWVTYRPTYRPI